jgi:hypothetical protein
MEISTYALLSNLLEDLGFQSMPSLGVTDADSPTEAAKLSLAHSLLKKFKAGESEKADSAALLKFLESNFRARNWGLQLHTSADEELWGEFKRSIYDFWFDADNMREPLCESDTDLAPLAQGKLGPGSSIGAIGESFYAKLFNSTLSCTNYSLYSSYKNYIARFPIWQNADDIRVTTVKGCNVVGGSRLSFVPKNVDISRCICTEPSLNMYYQLGLGDVLTKRLRDWFGIDLRDQPERNRDLARIGSIYDSNVTIDLASASDSIGLNFCKEVLPKSLLDILHRYRCVSTDIPGLGNFQLDIISSMGNGFTFPLQTMLFAAMVNASFVCADIKLPRNFIQKSWGVFGDDIIVPKGKIARNLLRLLKLAGFTVNDSKSFFEGRFRESCGADYFDGRDIRGVYLESLDSPQDAFVAINRLNLFSTRTGLKLNRTVQYLMGFCPRVFVPLHENEDAGIRVPFCLAHMGGKKVLVDDHGSALYKAFRPVVRRITFSENGIVTPKFLRKKGYFFNGAGAWIAFLQRSLESCGFSLRLKTVPYELRTCISPCWDARPGAQPDVERVLGLLEPDTSFPKGWIPWRRLDDAVYLNVLF